MKKSILFILSCIPLLASCNNNSNGFPNPFPDDDYHPYGFTFKADERVSRTLTTTEQALVNSSEGKNDEYVRQHTIATQTRDYTRAFAGEFQQGYASSNIKKTETSITSRQDADLTTDPKIKCRTVTKNHLDATYDYSYGRNTSEVDTTEWVYYAKEKQDFVNKKEVEVTETDASSEDDATYIVSQIKSTESSTNTGSMLAKKATDWDHDPDAVFSNGLIHSEFLTPLAKCSSTPGADKKDNVILVKVEQNKYKDPSGKAAEGIYELPDGRRYQAMENSLTVSRLELKKAVTTGVEKTDWDTDWYLVSYARKYTEITITSKIIQPNVPIEMLTNPIVIHYTEEEHTFSIDEPSEKSVEDIEPVTIEDEE